MWCLFNVDTRFDIASEYGTPNVEKFNPYISKCKLIDLSTIIQHSTIIRNARSQNALDIETCDSNTCGKMADVSNYEMDLTQELPIFLNMILDQATQLEHLQNEHESLDITLFIELLEGNDFITIMSL